MAYRIAPLSVDISKLEAETVTSAIQKPFKISDIEHIACR